MFGVQTPKVSHFVVVAADLSQQQQLFEQMFLMNYKTAASAAAVQRREVECF